MLSEAQFASIVEQVTQDLFSKVKYQAFLNGKQIAEFCHYEQVNRFLLFQIYIDWKAHIQKLKHPYFNFQHPEVKDALEEFLNVLSNHIQVEQKDFKVLLEKAVYNTLKLLEDPLQSYINFFFSSKSEVSTVLISQYLPYFHDFDFVLQSILLYAENHQLEKISKERFQELFKKSILNYESYTGQSIEKYRSQKLGELLGNSINKLENQVVEKPKEDKKIKNVEKEDRVHVVQSQPIVNQPVVLPKKEIKIKKIPLNKQFQYSQKLFKGDLEALKKFCDSMSEIQDLETAKNLIQTTVLEKYQIDPEDSLFQELVGLALAHIV
jgi:hypothetical protein